VATQRVAGTSYKKKMSGVGGLGPGRRGRDRPKAPTVGARTPKGGKKKKKKNKSTPPKAPDKVSNAPAEKGGGKKGSGRKYPGGVGHAREKRLMGGWGGGIQRLEKPRTGKRGGVHQR